MNNNNQEIHNEDSQQTTTSTTRQLSQEEIVQLYVNNKQNRENHFQIAKQLNDVFSDRWFTIDMIAHKTLLKDKKQISEMMLALQLFNFVIAKQGGVNFKHKTKFKLLLTAEDRLKVLDENKLAHLKQIELIDKEREELIQEINQRDLIEK